MLRLRRRDDHSGYGNTDWKPGYIIGAIDIRPSHVGAIDLGPSHGGSIDLGPGHVRAIDIDSDRCHCHDHHTRAALCEPNRSHLCRHQQWRHR